MDDQQPQQKYYSLYLLRKTWLNGNETSDSYNKIKLFLTEPEFYFDRLSTPFYIGNDGKRVYLMFDETLYQVIKEQGESLIGVKLESVEAIQDVKILEMVQYRDRKDYYTIIKRISKTDKRMRLKVDHHNNKITLERAKGLLVQRTHFFISIDVENYELDHSCILEVGVSVFDSKRNLFTDLHLLIKDHYQLRNYKYVPDRKENFLFGKSLWIQLTDLPILMQTLINKFSPGILIGHGVECDIKFLEKIGTKFNSIETVFDTAVLHKAFLDDCVMQTFSLSKALDLFNIPNKYLHNASNDAHFTLELFFKLCGVNQDYF